jgi:hypothetical protein
MLWHVCGTPGRLPVVTDRGRPKFGLLIWALMGAPSRIRTCGLLLRRQSLYPLSYRGRAGRPDPA